MIDIHNDYWQYSYMPRSALHLTTNTRLALITRVLDRSKAIDQEVPHATV